MEILVLAALLGILPAAIARSKGRSFFGFWIYGALLFIVALPHAILCAPNTDSIEARQLSTGERRKCPHCAELIKKEARICRYCGNSVEPENDGNGEAYEELTAESVIDSAPPDNTVIKAAIFSLIVIGAVIILAYMLGAEAAAGDYAWPVVKVIDGDTVQVDASADMPPELAAIKVRLRDVDTPETWRPKCDRERRAGKTATAFVKRRIAAAGSILVRDPKWGKYGGRVVANLILDRRTLSDLLIEAKHGRPYTGDKRAGWCD